MICVDLHIPNIEVEILHKDSRLPVVSAADTKLYASSSSPLQSDLLRPDQLRSVGVSTEFPAVSLKLNADMVEKKNVGHFLSVYAKTPKSPLFVLGRVGIEYSKLLLSTSKTQLELDVPEHNGNALIIAVKPKTIVQNDKSLVSKLTANFLSLDRINQTLLKCSEHREQAYKNFFHANSSIENPCFFRLPIGAYFGMRSAVDVTQLNALNTAVRNNNDCGALNVARAVSVLLAQTLTRQGKLPTCKNIKHLNQALRRDTQNASDLHTALLHTISNIVVSHSKYASDSCIAGFELNSESCLELELGIGENQDPIGVASMCSLISSAEAGETGSITEQGDCEDGTHRIMLAIEALAQGNLGKLIENVLQKNTQQPKHTIKQIADFGTILASAADKNVQNGEALVWARAGQAGGSQTKQSSNARLGERGRKFLRTFCRTFPAWQQAGEKKVCDFKPTSFD